MGPQGRGSRAFMWFSADMSALIGISEFLQGWLAHQAGYRDYPEECYLVELAVIEACTNVIRYAYGDFRGGRLGIVLKAQDENIEIIILDEGSPFNPTDRPAPDLEEVTEGGYGIFLIHQIMQDIHYHRRGSRWNCLVLLRENLGRQRKEGLAR